MGGCNIDTAFTRADSDFSMSLLKNWRKMEGRMEKAPSHG